MWVPLFVIVLGMVWLLKNLGLIDFPVWSIIWPILVIIFGLSMFYKGGKGSCCHGWWCHCDKKK